MFVGTQFLITRIKMEKKLRKCITSFDMTVSDFLERI